MGTLGEYMGAGTGTTLLNLHLNGNNTDSSGSSRSGSDTAITYSVANGKFGQGASFNGSTSRISYATAAALNPASFTLSLWLNPNTAINAGIWAASASGGPTIWVNGTSLGMDKAGTVAMANISNAVTKNIWQYVVVTYNGSTGDIIFYVNGKIAGSANSTQTFTQKAMDIGVNLRTGGGDWYNGKMDEFVLENSIWTYQQVYKQYTNYLGRFQII